MDQYPVPLGGNPNIPDMVRRPLQEIAVPENAVHAEGILILQVAAAAPFQDLDPEGVGPLPDIGRHVKFRLQMAALGEARILAVDPNICEG